MPDWNLANTDPFRGLAQGNAYVNSLYDQASRLKAGRAYAAGDTKGASAALASRGKIGEAEALNTSVASRAKVAEDDKIKRFQTQHALLQKVTPFLTDAFKQGGPQMLNEAFTRFLPHFKSLGSDDVEVQKTALALQNDPQGTLGMLEAMAEKKLTATKSGDDTVFTDERGNEITRIKGAPSGADLARDANNPFKADGTPNTAFQKYETDKSRQLAEDRRAVIINNPMPGNSGASYNDQTVDLLADQYLTTGQMPPLGFGNAGAESRRQVLSRAASMAKDRGQSVPDIVAGRADVKANTQTLAQVTKYRNMVESFEQTAVKNADMALRLAPKGGAKGSVPLLNRWIQAGRKDIAGDPDVVSFNAALVTFKNEYAKIMSGATGAAGSTDSARAEADELISSAFTQEQLRRTIETMKQEMENRRVSLIDQEASVRSTLSGRKQAAPANASQPQAETVENWVRGPDGKLQRAN